MPTLQPADANFGARYPAPSILPDPIIQDPTLPLISLITPSFQQGQFIGQTIESALTQDYPNVELWVIDGGSTDETVSLLQQHARDPRLHWLSEPDQGQSDAINKGLARCQGELCAWLNSDDLLLPGALRTMANAWLAAGQPVILYGLGRHIDEAGRDLGYCPGQSAHMSLARLLWVGKHALVQPATFVPTQAARQVGGLDVTRHYALDLDLWVRLAAVLPIRFVARDIALYRLHAASKTIAAATRFMEEVGLIMEQAAARGALPVGQARSRTALYALRTYLMPGTIAFRRAQQALWVALTADPAVLPEAVLIVFKAMIRLVAGDRLWAWARQAKALLD